MNVNEELYFDWMCSLVCDDQFKTVYKDLLMQMFNTTFLWSHQDDENRVVDGLDLRYIFESRTGYQLDLRRQCTVLEVLIALSMKIENIMDDPNEGDRTGRWFMNMLVNLKVNWAFGRYYDSMAVDKYLQTFMNRTYESNGDGNIFGIQNVPYDLRTVDIWSQMLWYLDELEGEV